MSNPSLAWKKAAVFNPRIENNLVLHRQMIKYTDTMECTQIL